MVKWMRMSDSMMVWRIFLLIDKVSGKQILMKKNISNVKSQALRVFELQSLPYHRDCCHSPPKRFAHAIILPIHYF